MSMDPASSVAVACRMLREGSRRRMTGTCAACLGSLGRPSRAWPGLCDGCGLILSAWRAHGRTTTAAHLTELCTKGRARWGQDTPMWQWPLLWWCEVGWTDG